MAFLRTEKLRFAGSDRLILDNVEIEAFEGDFISIIGGSGSGKSTFLKICADLLTPLSGAVYFHDKDFRNWDPYELRKNITYLFQNPSLFMDTVLENLEYPYYLRKEVPDNNHILTLLEKVNLPESILREEIRNLSGGEKQRIALIRSLIFLPKVLLLDEITSALDQKNTVIVEKLIKDISDQGVTILWVTHDELQSRKYANRIIEFENGKIVKVEDIK